MRIQTSTSAPVYREEETGFILEVCVEMIARGEFGDSLDATAQEKSSPADCGSDPEDDEHACSQDFIVGRLWAEKLEWSKVEDCGFSVLDVCDAHSSGWLNLLEVLSRDGGETFRDEFDLQHYYSDVLWVQEILIHPEIADRTSLVAAALESTSVDNTLILMSRDDSKPHQLSDRECSDLGFKRIAGTELLLRDNHYRYPFGDAFPAGREIDFSATAEHEMWLLDHWAHRQTDPPSA